MIFHPATLKRLRDSGVKGISQVLILSHLHENGDTPLGELSKAVGVSAACMTGLIDQLEKDPALARRHDHPHDRRTKLVTLTDAGKELFS